MGIVKLNRNLVGEFAPGALGLLETANNIMQRGSHPEVLLLETEFFATIQVIVGIEDGADGLSSLLVCYRAFIVAAVELLEVKFAAGRFAGPEAEVIRRWGVIAGNWHVVRSGSNDLATFPVGHRLSIFVLRLANIAEESNLQQGKQLS